MAENALRTAPTHELPVIVSDGDTTAIYCVQRELTQTDMGYAVPDPSRPVLAAPHHVAVYADTVELRSPLVLPGRDVTIVARRLVLGPDASIDVSGADPEKTFPAGNTPEQVGLGAGADGSPGAGATAGGDAGNVTIVVEQLLSAAAPVAGAGPVIDRVDVAGRLADGLRHALAGAGSAAVPGVALPMTYFRSPFDSGPNPYPFGMFTGSLLTADATVDGLDQLAVTAVRSSPDATTVTVGLDARGLSLSLTGSLTITGLDTDPAAAGRVVPTPLTVAPFAVEVEVTVAVDRRTMTIGEPHVVATVPQGLVITQAPALTGEFEAVGRFLTDSLPGHRELVDRVCSGVAASVAPTVAAVLAAIRATLHTSQPPGLVVVARGRIGGRGQDGHAGIKGAKGVDGKHSDTEVYDAGTGWSPPPETLGKKGGPGGRAGSAGHSGAGGHGGRISVSFQRGSAVRVALDAECGSGGDPGRAGAPGDGGDGGDGGTYLVRELSISGNYGHDETGPGGPVGDHGGGPEFAGARGTRGADGTITVNGAPFTAGADAGRATYDLLAPSFMLDQLLMVQREGKLTYLNAAGKDDYDHAATLFLWLCSICPETVTSPDATNALPAHERLTRAAIRSAAQVELLRLHRGLDYFGHPYNWAPVLRLAHTQHRVTELITLGHIVEQQYTAYVDTNTSVAEKLAALDQTTQSLSSDVAASDAAEAVLQQQILVAETALASLQTDIETQVSVMKRHQDELETQIQRQVDDTCTLENVIKIVSAVVAIGAGAVNGISEITGAAEIAAIVEQGKKAAEAAGQLKSVIEQMQKTTSSLKDLASKLGAVDSAISADKPDSVKILAAREDFEETIKPLLEKFPSQAKELRTSVRAFFDLAQTRNDKVMSYNALFVQKATVTTHRQQVRAQIATIAALRSRDAQSLVPVSYLTFFKSALTWSKQNLTDLIYEETRAFYYHCGVSRAEVLEGISDLDIAALADTHARLLSAYDDFLTSVGRPYGPFTDVPVTITKDDLPSAFEGLATSGQMTFTLDHTHPHFADMTLVTVDSVQVRLPQVEAQPSDELNVAIQMVGDGAVRPVDELAESAVLRFNAAPRTVSYRYSYDPDRSEPVVEPGTIADEDYAPLSPFTTWRLDFGVAEGLNGFVPFADLQAVELRLSGHAFGRRAAVDALGGAGLADGAGGRELADGT